jgi:potassium-transporting ATPase KdpC subunit
MEMKKSSDGGKERADFRPVIGIAIVSLLLGGVFFPFFITGIAQFFFPTQANGDVVRINGQVVGSSNVAQNFTLPIFFHERNESQSASGLDPDITIQQADSQIEGISNATGIPTSSLQQIVNQNVDPEGRAMQLQYVNVLSLNLDLIHEYPSVYSAYT